MKRLILYSVLTALVVIPMAAQDLFPGLGEQRVGISAFTFLKIAPDPRGASLGESFTAISDDASAVYWNPAGIVRTGRNEVQFAQTSWFADISHRFAALTYQVTSSDAIGLSLLSLSTDPIPVRTVTQPTGTGQSFTYMDLAIGLSYSRRMTDQFSFGVTARYLHETIAELTMTNVVFDLGAFYATGFGSSRFAIVLSHFGNVSHPTGSVTNERVGEINTFEEFSPPTQFRLGFAIEPWQDENNRLTTTVQLNHPNDNAEHISIGAEYAWSELIMLRIGYRFNVQEQTSPMFGIGVRVPVGDLAARADYAAVPYSFLGTVHRIAIQLSL